MPRRKEIEELKKHLVNLYEGDYEKLQVLHPRLGASKAIRLMVRAHIQRVEEAQAQNAKPVQLDLDNIELQS